MKKEEAAQNSLKRLGVNGLEKRARCPGEKSGDRAKALLPRRFFTPAHFGFFGGSELAFLQFTFPFLRKQLKPMHSSEGEGWRAEKPV